MENYHLDYHKEIEIHELAEVAITKRVPSNALMCPKKWFGLSLVIEMKRGLQGWVGWVLTRPMANRTNFKLTVAR